MQVLEANNLTDFNVFACVWPNLSHSEKGQFKK